MPKWKEVSSDRYLEMLNVLPPALWIRHGFLVGEPWDHNEQGVPRFMAFARFHGKHYECLSPLTPREFQALSQNDVIASSL